jgi:hypothetical protein
MIGYQMFPGFRRLYKKFIITAKLAPLAFKADDIWGKQFAIRLL